MKLYPVLLLMVLLLAGCTEDITQPEPEPELPAETQLGLNTFGCKVNGKVFVPQGGGDYQAVEADVYVTEFSIVGTTAGTSNDLSVGVFFNNMPVRVGRYPIFDENFINTTNDYSVTEGPIFNNQCRAYAGFPGVPIRRSLEITFLDKENRIVSGRFSFTAGNECGTIYEVTEGRFDMRY